MTRALLLFIVVFYLIATSSSAWGEERDNDLVDPNTTSPSTPTPTQTLSSSEIRNNTAITAAMNIPDTTATTTTPVTNCSLVGILPFTRPPDVPYKSYQVPLGTNSTNTTSTSTSTSTRRSFEAPPYAVTHAAAALLATDHFNARQSILVPELADYTTTINCSVYIDDLTFFDSNSREGVAPKLLMEHYRANNKNNAPCAILGGYASTPTREAAVVANSMNTVLVTHGAEDARLVSPVTPGVTSTGSNNHPTAEAIVNWLTSKGRTDFVAVLHTSHDHGVTYADTLDNAARESNFTSMVYAIVGPPYTGMEPNQSIRLAMQKLQKTTYRTIVAVLNKYKGPQLDMVADLAEEFKMNTAEYVWVFVLPGEQTLDEFVVYGSENTNTSELLKGSALVRPLDGAMLEDSAFRQQVWNQQDESFVERLNGMLPKQFGVIPGDYFQQYGPEPGAGYMYDAVMTAAMGKCQELKAASASASPAKGGGQGNGQGGGPGNGGKQNNNNDGGNNNNNSPNNNNNRRRRLSHRRLRTKMEITREKEEDEEQQHQQHSKRRHRKLQKSAELLGPHMMGITSLEFTGVTGPLAWKNERRARNRQRTLMSWAVYNIRDIDANDKERMEQQFPTQNFTLWFYLTDILRGGPVNGEWTMTDDGPFLFSDGTSVPSALLRDDPKQNYLSPSVRIIGLTLMAVSLLCSMLVALLVWWHQEKPSIRGNQPFFLYILLAGTFVMAWSILFLSFDESDFKDYVISEESEEPRFLDIACTIFPWFLSLGYVLIYGTLFMKLWRINRVLQSRRTSVAVKQVVWPCIVLLGITIVILAVWTAIDPWQWERHPVDEDEPQGESYGRCSSDHDIVFILVLAVVMLGATVLAGLMAWKTKDVDSKFSESNWIFTTIVLQFQVLVVGIPILIIVQRASADATYMGRVLLIWTMAMSTLVLMFVPKLLPILLPKLSQRLSNPTMRSSLASGNVRVTAPAGMSNPKTSSGLTETTAERQYVETGEESSRNPNIDES